MNTQKHLVLLVLAWIAPLLSAGCNAKVEVRLSEEQTAEVTKKVESAASGLNEAVTNSGIKEKALEFTNMFASKVGGEWDSLKSEYSEPARQLLNSGGQNAEWLFQEISTEPKEGDEEWVRHAKNFGIAQVPLLRSVKRYADSRSVYGEAAKLSDSDKRGLEIHRAKKLCLLACIEGGIDVTILGTGGMTDTAARHANKVIGFLKKIQQVRKIANSTVFLSSFIGPDYIDQLDQFLEAGLRIPEINVAMGSMLTFDFNTLGDQVIGPQ